MDISEVKKGKNLKKKKKEPKFPVNAIYKYLYIVALLLTKFNEIICSE